MAASAIGGVATCVTVAIPPDTRTAAQKRKDERDRVNREKQWKEEKRRRRWAVRRKANTLKQLVGHTITRVEIEQDEWDDCEALLTLEDGRVVRLGVAMHGYDGERHTPLLLTKSNLVEEGY